MWSNAHNLELHIMQKPRVYENSAASDERLISRHKRKRQVELDPTIGHVAHHENRFDAFPNELLICILVALSSTATSPADLINAMLVSRRFYEAATSPLVLGRVGVPALAVKASAWCDGAQKFLIRCAEAGNLEACYILGMIRFYCLRDRCGGAALLTRAALSSHALALYSLAIIHFNGSGGSKKDKRAGAQLSARAASLGHVDAMREFGHCLQDGYGVQKDVLKGRRILLKSNAIEAAVAMNMDPRAFMENVLQSVRIGGSQLHVIHADNGATDHQLVTKSCSTHPLLSDYGCSLPFAKIHVSNKFLVEWFALHPPVGMLLCSYMNCGRSESRKHEFRKCSACGSAIYCSRACQALDWKLQHKHTCTLATG